MTPAAAETVELRGRAGNRIVMDVAGAASAPPVILLHGGGQTRRSWRRVIDRLRDTGYRVLAPDLRGHGDSDPAPDADYCYPRLIDDLAAVIAFAGGTARVVGGSLGGKVALAATAALPAGAITAIVMVDAVPRSREGGIARVASILRTPPEGFAAPQAAADMMARANGTTAEPTAGDRMRSSMRQRPDGRWTWHWDPWFFDSSHKLGIAPALSYLEDAAAAVTIPALLMRGERSDVVDAEGAQAIAALIPHLEISVIANAGHLVANDNPDGFCDVLLAFLARG